MRMPIRAGASSLRAVLVALAAGCSAALLALAGCGQSGGSSGAGPDSAASDAPLEGGGSDSTGPEGSGGDSSSADSTSADGADGGADSTAPGDADSDADSGDAAADGPYWDFDAGDCGKGPVGEPLDLSCTGLYSDWTSKTIASDVTAYEPGLHLWSDGADKSRWIYLPPGGVIDTSHMDEWVFPVGTRIWKEFSLPLGDASTDTRIETRLLVKVTPSVWYRTTYKWSADGTSSATELTAGEMDAGNGSYEIPAQYKCNACHQGRKDGVLGFEAVALSMPGATGLTMQDLVTQNLVTAAPVAPIVIPGDAIESAALGWLHVNCGQACHNRGNGIANFSGFFMRLDVATLTSVQSTDTYTTGWNQGTSGFFIPDAATTYRLHACDPSTSCAYYRASRRDGMPGVTGGTQMPPLDTHVVDTTGIAELTAWIEEGCDAGSGDQ
jgi:hypothetical protein